MDEVIVVNGSPIPFDKKVGLTNILHIEGREVKVIPDGEPTFGPTRVLVVGSGYDEVLAVVNPGSLPFDVKVQIYGAPPCPKCHHKLEVQEDENYEWCPNCLTAWPVYDLDQDTKGKIWPPGWA